MHEPPLPWRGIRISDVCQAVADYHHVFVDELVGDARPQWLLWIRYQAYLLAYETGKSSTAIGRVMRRDHSTILVGIKTAQLFKREYPAFARQVDCLRRLILQKASHRKVFGEAEEEE